MATFITLGKQERQLRFSYLSLVALENHYKKPLQAVFNEEMKSGKLEDLTVIIWACLRKEKLSLPKVFDLIDESIEDEETTLTEISEKVAEALQNSTILKGAEDEGDGDEAKN